MYIYISSAQSHVSFLHKDIKQMASSLSAVINRVSISSRAMSSISLYFGYSFASYLLVTFFKPVWTEPSHYQTRTLLIRNFFRYESLNEVFLPPCIRSNVFSFEFWYLNLTRWVGIPAVQPISFASLVKFLSVYRKAYTIRQYRLQISLNVTSTPK